MPGGGVPLRRLGRPDLLAAWVAHNNLAGAVVSPPPPLYLASLPSAERARWVAVVNEGMGEACSPYGAALRPLAYLPVEAPAEAARVAAMLDDRWAGVVAGTDLRGGTYSGAALDELWEVAADRDLVVFVHPGHCHDPRLEPFYLTNLLGNPYETTVAAAHLVFAGVFERFPRLRVVLAHGGGAVAALAGRWQRGYDTDRPGVAKLELSPLEAVRRFYVDSLAHHAGALRLACEVVGVDRVLLGTDWPFPMGADSADEALDGLTAAEAAAVQRDNPRRCFGNRLEVTGTRDRR